MLHVYLYSLLMLKSFAEAADRLNFHVLVEEYIGSAGFLSKVEGINHIQSIGVPCGHWMDIEALLYYLKP